MTRVFLIVPATLAIVTFVLSLFGLFPFDVTWVAFLVAIVILPIWGWRRYSIGSVRLSSEELIVKSKAHTSRYPWTDIEQVRTATLEEAKAGTDAWILRSMGIDRNRPVAIVGLRQQYFESLLRHRSGTRTSGIPRGMTVQIEVEDVPGFVEAANQFLAASRS